MSLLHHSSFVPPQPHPTKPMVKSNKGNKMRISKEELYDLYWNQELTLLEIAKRVGCGRETIRHYMVKYGIPRRSPQGPISKETLQRLYFKEKMSLAQIAEKLGTSITRVFNWMEHYGLKRRDVSSATRLNPPKPPNKLEGLVSKEELKELYYDKKLSLAQIANKLHCSLSTVYRRMEYYGFPRRSKSEAVKLNPPETVYTSETVQRLSKERWKNPKYRERMVRIARRALQKAHKLWDNPTFRKVRSERMRRISKRLLSDPNYKKRAIAILRNPETQKKAIKAVHKSPNKPERRLMNLLHRNKLPYKYTGSGQFLIGNLNPDFVSSNGEKKVIEVFGRVYHDPNFSFRDRIPITQTTEGRIAYYRRHGWSCLIIWDDEILNHEEEVLVKIKEFEGVSECQKDIVW